MAAVVHAKKTMEELCLENGYAIESYTVLTPDDYVLSLYRIPGTVNEIGTEVKKPAVLMVHGLDADSMQWVGNLDPAKTNAFILSNAGYDVWMGNNRGTPHCNTHLTLSSKDKAYWDYYQMELGTLDVPTFIDFVLEKTALETLSYVGHSQGTT